MFPPFDSAFSWPAGGQHHEATLPADLIGGLGSGSQTPLHLRINWGALKTLRNSGLRWERGEERGEKGEGTEMYKLPVMKTVQECKAQHGEPQSMIP